MIFVSSKISDGNMSFEYGNLKLKEVLENRKKFLKKLGIKNAFEVKQIHGNNVVIVEDPLKPATAADGMITNKPGIFLMVKTADCIPIAFYDPKNKTVGLIHVGYKGLEKGIIKNTIKLLQKTFNTNPQVLEVKFGPSIGPCHYRLDLWKEAENQLISFGVLQKNVDNPKICTYENKDYFSHRRAENNNLPDSRFVTILGLK